MRMGSSSVYDLGPGNSTAAIGGFGTLGGKAVRFPGPSECNCDV